MQKMNDENFSQIIINAKLPLLVDFWADWCGPCKLMLPLLEQLETEFNNRVDFAKAEMEHNLKTGAHYHIRSIPTFLLFKNGKMVDSIIGARQKNQLASWIESHLG
jgi:thioredoxin 1